MVPAAFENTLIWTIPEMLFFDLRAMEDVAEDQIESAREILELVREIRDAVFAHRLR
jgi:hypothetical protein